MTFKQTHTFEDRCAEVKQIMEKYPHKIPIICERSQYAPKDCPEIDKNRYLVPDDLTVGQFVYVIRKRLKMPPEKAIFLFTNGYIPPSSAFLIDIYCCYKDEDGFLYVTYTFENTFG